MLLATHHHIFYEFVPVACMHLDQPDTVLLRDLRVGECYEMVVTTDGGLWRYRIGDVVEITAVEPVHIRVAGRTKSFLNMFGEEVMVHTTDDAIQAVCTQRGIHISDYVVTAVRDGDGGYHHRYIDSNCILYDDEAGDTKNTTLTPESIAHILDVYIQTHNSDYAAKRA
jgi:GH3 auxin-responsive promoter